MDYFDRRLTARDDDLPAISGLNPALWSVIAKALRSEPKMRQGDSSALYDDIARYFTSGEGVDDGGIDFSNTLATDMLVMDRLLAERATWTACWRNEPHGPPAGGTSHMDRLLAERATWTACWRNGPHGPPAGGTGHARAA